MSSVQNEDLRNRALTGATGLKCREVKTETKRWTSRLSVSPLDIIFARPGWHLTPTLLERIGHSGTTRLQRLKLHDHYSSSFCSSTVYLSYLTSEINLQGLGDREGTDSVFISLIVFVCRFSSGLSVLKWSTNYGEAILMELWKIKKTTFKDWLKCMLLPFLIYIYQEHKSTNHQQSNPTWHILPVCVQKWPVIRRGPGFIYTRIRKPNLKQNRAYFKSSTISLDIYRDHQI